MSLANALWGAPRIHGELLKLGIEVAQSTVAKYMARGRRPPSQSWKTFLRNHAAGIAAMDLLVVPTIGFRFLYVLVILGHHRRRILSFGVTSHPTADWIARQLTDAFPWTEAPRYLIRDRDAAMVKSSPDASRAWASVIGQRLRDHLGRTDTSNG
jgi:transposase InsO family protein